MFFVSDFCQKLQRSQDKAVRREKGELVSSDEDLAPRKKKGDDDIDFLKHPFALKPVAPITINIPVSCSQLYSTFHFYNPIATMDNQYLVYECIF